MKKKFDGIKNLINKAKNIALFTHIKPDPDAIGSIFATYLALEQIKKNVTIFLEESISNYNALPNIKTLNEFKENKFDLIIAVDVANTILLGKFENQFLNFENSICIDHHLTREKIGKCELVDSEASSTTEILFDIFKALNIKIDKNIANYLYFGIIGDTGRFLYKNTTSKTFLTAHELSKKGADIYKINLSLMRKLTKNTLKNLQILYNNIDIKKNILFSSISKKDCKKYKCQLASSSELINFLTNIDKIDIIVLLTEKEKKKVSASLRCTELFNVSYIAQAFGGGGHKLASGMQNMSGSIKHVKNKIFKFIKNNMNIIKTS